MLLTRFCVKIGICSWDNWIHGVFISYYVLWYSVRSRDSWNFCSNKALISNLIIVKELGVITHFLTVKLGYGCVLVIDLDWQKGSLMFNVYVPAALQIYHGSTIFGYQHVFSKKPCIHNRACRLAIIAVIINLVPSHLIKFLQLIWRSGTRMCVRPWDERKILNLQI